MVPQKSIIKTHYRNGPFHYKSGTLPVDDGMSDRILRRKRYSLRHVLLTIQRGNPFPYSTRVCMSLVVVSLLISHHGLQ